MTKTLVERLRERGETEAADRIEKLEAVEVGIVTFEDEFLANIVLPDGGTVAEHVKPRIAASYASNTMQPLLPGPGGA